MRELVERVLDGVASPGEIAELERRIAADPAAADAYVRAARRDQAFALHFGDARGACNERSRFVRYIAAAALLLAAAAGWLLLRGEPDLVLRGPAVHRYPGEATTITLRAGAEALLGGDGDAKEIELRAGELEADVAPQRRPMLVRTPQAEVRVLGTRFTLSIRGAATTLEVAEGRVAFTRKTDGASVDVGPGRSAGTAPGPLRDVSTEQQRFLTLRAAVLDATSGYFSPSGVPYHAVERLVIDAPDHGRLSTSEAFSYWLWMEACYGRVSRDWEPFRRAWGLMDRALVPSPDEQPARPIGPALLAPEAPRIEDYPVELGAAGAADDLAPELRAAYGTDAPALMHWLVDPDNESGFGRRGDRTARNALLNTFQRGPRESVWETIPHPSWEDFASGPNGYLPLFVKEKAYVPQWRYVSAPDAEARALQAAYWASVWAPPGTPLPLAEAARMGDSLRYALRERGFRARHGLLGWSVGWGGSIDAANGWAWRLGASHVHAGYQNPVAAWALATSLRPRSTNGAREWAESLERQLEFLARMQSPQGAFAAGGRIRADGSLEPEVHPVFLDPPSNEWFGWQAWTADRLAQYLLASGDARAKPVVERWAAWAKRVVVLKPDGAYALPGKLVWSGGDVAVEGETEDVGVAAATARALATWAKAAGDDASRALARELLDRIWRRHFDGRGLSNPEARPDYARLHDPVHWPGRPGLRFLDLRPTLRSDPDLPRVEALLRRGEPPVFRFHRFWAQAEAAVAYAEYARLFP